MPNVNLWGWDTPNTEWVKVLVDAAGHLQVDTLTSALPALAATAANQVLIIGHIDGIEALLGGGLPAALDGLSLKVKEQSPIAGFATSANQVLINANLASLVTEQGRCYGWDGTAWQTLLVEDATNFNLRVRLYDGANGIASFTISDLAWVISGKKALATLSTIGLVDSATVFRPWCTASFTPDADLGRKFPCVGLSGYNGSYWDRLRTYGTGILKVGRAEVGLLTDRKTAVGQVGAAGARKLYWMTMNPTAAASVVELTDDTDGSTAVVWDMTHGVNAAHHMNLDPPMEFANGIYLKTFTNFTSIIFGYL